LGVCPVVAAGFGNVDFARLRPDAVCIFDRHHPDGRPEPVASRKFGGDFNTAVFDDGPLFSVDATRFDWVDDGTVGGVGCSNAVGELMRGADALLGEVNYVIMLSELGVLQSGFDSENAVLDKNILFSDRGFFELAVPREMN
jgi:hypothetical protein